MRLASMPPRQRLNAGHVLLALCLVSSAPLSSLAPAVLAHAHGSRPAASSPAPFTTLAGGLSPNATITPPPTLTPAPTSPAPASTPTPPPTPAPPPTPSPLPPAKLVPPSPPSAGEGVASPWAWLIVVLIALVSLAGGTVLFVGLRGTAAPDAPSGPDAPARPDQ